MASKRDKNAPEWRVTARFARGQRGSVAAEYVIMLAVIGAMLAVGAMGLGSAISGAMGKHQKCMENAKDAPQGKDNPCANNADK